jgi:signal transduction histidine kinase
VEVSATEKDIRIAISDNGRGTHPGSSGDAKSRKGFGLIGITERAHAMNGAVTIESRPGKGTTLTVVIPGSRKPA